jgi:hypothetical protein
MIVCIIDSKRREMNRSLKIAEDLDKRGQISRIIENIGTV